MEFTDNQIKAINHKDGNLKIIACAGSGKTTVMSERIARLVSEGADRDKIVAFTFTEKASDSLKFKIREKLLDFCSDSPHLGGLYVGTIHSFAFKKLKDLMPKYRSYEVLDEVKRIIWLQKNYNKIGLKNIKVDVRYFDSIQSFLRTVDIIRDNEVPYEDLEKIPDFKEVYENYLDLLEKEKYLDFSGILYKLVEVIESNSGLLNEIKESVEYLVVDEYQDINHIQEKLISLIVGTDGNLCVVGDDDQSIFEFQGADVNNIIQFEDRYDNVKIIKLEKNFRCSKEIIESAGDLIRRNRNRIKKSMVPGEIDGIINTSQDGDVYKVEFETINDEVSFIINKIKELRGCEYDDDGIKRGIDYGDIAVIIRTKLSAQRLIEPFRREGIKFTFKGTGGLFQRPEIDFIRLIFCYFAEHSADKYSPDKSYIPVTLNDLGENFKSLNIKHIEWNIFSSKIEELKEELKSVDSKNPDASKRRIFLQEFFYKVTEALGVNQNNFSEDVMYDFGRLSKLVAEFEAVHGWINYFYFTQFVIFINGYAQNKTDEGGIDDPRNTNSVNILTVHQAKGLEFPVVFIPDLSVRRFPSQNRNKKPNTHLDGIFDLQKYCSGDEGERRLFYVATTRTRKFLFITRSKLSDTDNKASRSKYFTEFDHEIMLCDNESDPTIRKIIKPQCKPNMELMPTSFSDLRHYIVCPYSYQLQQIMGFSPVINVAYGYGLQVHNLLNYMHKKWENKPPKIADIEALMESDFFLRFTRGIIYDNMKAKAKDILKTYVNEYGSEFPLKLETEKPFEFIMGGALISGEIDLIQKIDPISNEVKDVSILDFKTEKEKLETKDLIRLQLRLYALAGDKSLGLNPKSAKIHYLTENFRQDIDISENKLKETQNKISEVIDDIKTGNFKSCPGDSCKKCDVRSVCNSVSF